MIRTSVLAHYTNFIVRNFPHKVTLASARFQHRALSITTHWAHLLISVSQLPKQRPFLSPPSLHPVQPQICSSTSSLSIHSPTTPSSLLPSNLRFRLLGIHIQFPSRSRRIQGPIPTMDAHLLFRTRQHLMHSSLACCITK